MVWLIREGGLSINATDREGFTPLLCAAAFGRLPLVKWLLDHGADVADVTKNGMTVWTLLGHKLSRGDDGERKTDPDATVTALLRVMVLCGAPPAWLIKQLSPDDLRVVQKGARLRAGLPAYLARRQALLAEHCPLIAPLLALVHGYETPTTTDELWATGLGAARQHAARPRADNVDAAAPLRRSARIRQKRE
jgi:hypothetical protein